MFKRLPIFIIVCLCCALFTDAATAGPAMRGKASWYQGSQRLASGGRFNPDALTAAHRTLPFGTLVRVTHLTSRRSVVVRINDRGPYSKNRIIDVSRAAARELHMMTAGVAAVSLEVVGAN